MLTERTLFVSLKNTYFITTNKPKLVSKISHTKSIFSIKYTLLM